MRKRKNFIKVIIIFISNIMLLLLPTINVYSQINDSVNEVALAQSIESGVIYQTHVQDYGWQSWKSNGQLSGTEGQSKRLEGIRIKIEGLANGANILYRTHIQDYGWQSWKYNGEFSGTEGNSKRLEGIEIKLEGLQGYHVEYRVHVQDYGWQEWRKDGEMAGTKGQSKRLEAIEVKIIQDEVPDGITYSTLIKNEGWNCNVLENKIAGSSSNNAITSMKINYKNNNGISIKYRAYVQNFGWQQWMSNGRFIGDNSGKNNIEAFQIKLENAPANYHIKYRVKTKKSGWQIWKTDGQTAGATAISAEITAIQIKIVNDDLTPKIQYQTHVQNDGWQSWVESGQLSGTEGRSLRLEGIKIKIDNLDRNNSIMYRTHVQNDGWQQWVTDGSFSGTEGRGLRLESIQIKLKEEIPGYKLYYRVHVQDYGWQDWKMEGEMAGTVGQAKRLEAIEIKLVKGKSKLIVLDAGHNYGGDDGAYATHSGVKYCERDLNMSVATKLKRELELYGFDVVMTRKPEDIETIEMKESLKKRVNIANELNADLFISIHQNSIDSSSISGVEVYYSTATPLTGGRLLSNGVEYNEVAPRDYTSNEKISISRALSKNIVNSIESNMNRKNRGYKDNDFYVIKNTIMPSILIECGFISNASEAKKLADESLQQTMSSLIAKEVNKKF